MPRTRLTVQPIRRTYRPCYPSYQDPNPLLEPSAHPYPFSKRMLQALGAAGFSGALLLSSLTACDSTKTASSRPVADSGNPFPLAAMHLPYTPVMFGTGLPSRLDRQTAIETINKVFQEELPVQYDTLVQANGISVIANAYNTEHRIGYVWVNYDNMGAGTVQETDFNYHSVLSYDKQVEVIETRIGYQWQQYSTNTEQFLKQLRNRKTKPALVLAEELSGHLTEENRLNKPAFQTRFLQYERANNLAHYQGEEEASTLARLLIQVLTRESSTLKALAKTNILHRGFRAYSGPHSRVGDELSSLVDQELQAIVNTKNYNTWGQRSDALLDVLGSVQHYALRKADNPAMLALTDVMQNPNWRQRPKKLAAIHEVVDKQLLSLHELQILAKSHRPEDSYIAPISIRDDRMILRNMDIYSVDAGLLKQMQHLQQQWRSAEEGAAKDSLHQQMNEIQMQQDSLRKQQQLDSRQQTLQHLETDVRAYIRWAKGQQGY